MKRRMDDKNIMRLKLEQFPTEVFTSLFGSSTSSYNKPLESTINKYTFNKLVYVRRTAFVAKVTDKDGKAFAIKFYYEPDEPVCYYEKELLGRLKEKNCSNILLPQDFHNNEYGYYFIFPFVKQKEPPREFPAVWIFLKDVATAIAECHSNNIIHGDIKSSNILTSKSDEVYLCDFDTAVEPPDNVPFTGTAPYWSPEICRNEYRAQNFPRDVWAFGVVVIETVYKKYPFAEIDNYATDYDNAETLLESYEEFLLSAKVHGEKIDIPPKWKVLITENDCFLLWPNLLEHPVSNDQVVHHLLLQQLLKMLLTLDPKSRCTISEALEYLKNVIKINDMK